MNLFDPRHTHRPDGALLFKKGDPNDPRLGERVQIDEDGYADAQVVIIGCPQDEGVRRNGGRAGAALAPTEIRRALYKLSINSIEQVRLFDLGDTVIQPALEATHDLHNALMRQIVTDGKRIIALGGGNDLSYPDCAALSPLPLGEGHGVRESGDTIAFNIDTHFDVRADAPRNSGTPYRQLLEEGYVAPENFYEIGSHPFATSSIYERYLRDKGAHVIPLDKLRQKGIESTFAFLNSSFSILDSLFWGFDLDVVRVADAPGVSAPNPIGMTGDELCQIAAIAGRDPRTRIVEFTEVNPNYDVDGRTARLTAAAIWHVLAGFAKHI